MLTAQPKYTIDKLLWLTSAQAAQAKSAAAKVAEVAVSVAQLRQEHVTQLRHEQRRVQTTVALELELIENTLMDTERALLELGQAS
jgi:hypothetical protein